MNKNYYDAWSAFWLIIIDKSRQITKHLLCLQNVKYIYRDNGINIQLNCYKNSLSGVIVSLEG